MNKKKPATNGAKPKKAATRTKAKPKKVKKELTANELTYLAWKDTYAKRHKRVE